MASFRILFLCEFNLWQEFLEVLLLAGSLRAEVREWADCLIAGQTTTGQLNQNFKWQFKILIKWRFLRWLLNARITLCYSKQSLFFERLGCCKIIDFIAAFLTKVIPYEMLKNDEPVEYSSDSLPLFFNRSSSCGVHLHVQPRRCHHLHHGYHLRYYWGLDILYLWIHTYCTVLYVPERRRERRYG